MDKITVMTTVNAPIEKVWECWNGVEHIEGWAFATPEWGAEGIENTVEKGGTFKHRMFAKDGSASFDMEGTYTSVEPNSYIEYVMSDGREVSVEFIETDDGVEIVEMFDPESENTPEAQQEGWQAYLDNFKSYVEGQ